MNNQAFSKIWLFAIFVVFVVGGVLSWQYFKSVSSENFFSETASKKLFSIPSEHSILEEKSGVGGGGIEHPVSGDEHYGFSFYHMYFSPNNKHFAYAVAEDKTYFFVVDGEKEKKYDAVSGFTFSSNSQHYAYSASKSKNGYIIFDGEEQKKYNWVQSPIFSPDSKRFAYIAIDTSAFGFLNKFVVHAAIGGEYFVILDGTEQKKYDRIFNLTFSPDSKHFAYTAQQGEDWLVVFDGIEQGKYDSWVNTLTFSPDSKHFAFSAEREGGWIVVLDGEVQGRYDTRVGSLIFSSDAEQFAYQVGRKSITKGEKEFAVLNGQKQKEYDLVFGLTFSSDGKHFAYIAVEHFGTKEHKRFVVLDGEAQKKYDLVIGSSLVFSPDNKRFAYIARGAEKEFIVLDGEEYEKRDLIIHSCLFSEFEFVITTHVFPPIFSPDSKHFAYIAEEGEKQFVILDNVEQQKQYDIISKCRFDPQSKHFLYNGIIMDQGVWSVVEGIE